MSSLVGIKSEFKNEYLETNLFASETSLANIREEIPGNGTAGRYFLSRGDIVDFTENIVIQVRDRFQTGQILSETPLARNRDYDIDYDLGLDHNQYRSHGFWQAVFRKESVQSGIGHVPESLYSQ